MSAATGDLAGADLREFPTWPHRGLVRSAVAGLGGRPDVPEADRADLPDLGSAFNEQAVWRYHVGTLALRGLADVG